MKKFIFIFFTAAMAAVVVGCSGKGGSTARRGGGYYPGGGVSPGCTNCSGNQSPLVIGAQGTHSAVSIGLDLTGDPNAMMQQGINPNDPYAVTAYYGPAQIYGYARLNNVCFYQFNGAEYYLRTQRAGVSAYGAVSGVILEAIPTSGGGPSMIWVVGNSQFYDPNGLQRNSPSARVGLNFEVYINNQKCDQISTN